MGSFKKYMVLMYKMRNDILLWVLRNRVKMISRLKIKLLIYVRIKLKILKLRPSFSKVLNLWLIQMRLDWKQGCQFLIFLRHAISSWIHIEIKCDVEAQLQKVQQVFWVVKTYQHIVNAWQNISRNHQIESTHRNFVNSRQTYQNIEKSFMST